IVGLLADADRRAVVAALTLGATDLASVRAASGLDSRGVTRALGRLVDAGLVERDADGALHLRAELFGAAARVEAQRAASQDTADEHAGASREEAKVLRTFVRKGRIVQIPAPRKSRLVVLDWLSQHFEPGERYSERMVNLIIGRVHADIASLRRYLVDE